MSNAKAGDNVGILLRNIKPEFVQRGMFICQPDSLQQNDSFEVQLYVLLKSEGGRSKPLTNNYIQMMYSNTWNISCCVKIPDDKTMIMPGDASSASIVLRKPMVIREGQRFTIRENHITTVTGVVTKALPNTEEKIVGFNYERPRSIKIEGNAYLVMKNRGKR